MTRCEARRIPLAAALICAAGLTAYASKAHGQAEDQAAARVLFEQGRSLMKGGHYTEACPKLDAARKLFVSAGILLNLADCHEKIGRTASAWTEFGEAAAVAKRTNRENDAEEATRRQAALEPTLARLTIRVAHPIPGLSVKRDGAPIAPAAWGAALPVDPGTHEIHAEAAGFEPWTSTAGVSTAGEAVTVDVPALRATLGAPQPAADGKVKPVLVTVVPGETAQESNVLPWALIGGGGAVAVGGVVLMLVEAGHASDARTNNDPAKYDAAKTPWTVGLVGAIAGVATAGVGAALLVARPGESAPGGSTVYAWWGPSAGGLRLAGSW
jgi:hypothetical protein